MEPDATVVAFNCKRASVMLHCKIIANGSRPITDEVECCRKAATGKKCMKEIIKCELDWKGQS